MKTVSKYKKINDYNLVILNVLFIDAKISIYKPKFGVTIVSGQPWFCKLYNERFVIKAPYFCRCI